MRNENFDIPVTIETGGASAAGRERIVTDTIQAAEILLRRWPDDGRGQKYKAALRACMDAMEQRRAVASARQRRAVASAGRRSWPRPRTHISSCAPAISRSEARSSFRLMPTATLPAIPQGSPRLDRKISLHVRRAPMRRRRLWPIGSTRRSAMRRRHRNLLGHRDFSVRLLLDGWRRRVPACRPIRHEFIDEAAQDISHDVLHGNHVKRATSAKVPSRTRDRASRSSCTPRAGRFSAFFHVGAAAADANDYIVYNKATGALFYDDNGNGAGHAIAFAVLTNHPVLAANDFVVI